jgi:hypothetical protein
MSSRDSTPDDDNMRAMREAMAQSSPPKRTHSTMTGNEDLGSEHTAAGTASGIRTNQNIVSAARQYAERKRLRGDQVTALEVFLNVSSAFLCFVFCFVALAHDSVQGTPLSPRGQDGRRPLGPRKPS